MTFNIEVIKRSTPMVWQFNMEKIEQKLWELVFPRRTFVKI